jgi:CshA-type fibril repeat protein
LKTTLRKRIAMLVASLMVLGPLPAVIVSPAATASASTGTFDQPASDWEWTYPDDTAGPESGTPSSTFMSASNLLALSDETVSVVMSNAPGWYSTLVKRPPATRLLGVHGAVAGNFLAPPVDTSTLVVAPRVDDGAGGFGYCTAPASVITDDSGFIPAGSSWTCPDIGTMTIIFSEPVVNPLISLSGLGGGQFAAGGGGSDLLNNPLLEYLNSAELKLISPAGATVELMAGNGNLTASGVDIGVPVPATYAFCNSAYQVPSIGGNPGFAARAGCGTVRINGTGTTFTFSLSKKVYTIEDSDDSSFAGSHPMTRRTSPDLFSMQIGTYLPATQTITYDGNGATSGSVSDDTAPTGWDVTLAANGFTPPSTQVFLGWSTDPNATSADPTYDPADIIDMPAGGLTLYAVWDTPILGWLVYDANGGSGSMSPTGDAIGSAVSIRANGFTPPVGTTFSGWSTNPSGPVEYQAGASIPIQAGGQTLYAVWTPIPPPVAPPVPDSVVQAKPDTVVGRPGESVVLDPIANDSSDGQGLIASSLRLCAIGSVSPECAATQVSVPQGVWSIDTDTGQVTFTPAPGFTGSVDMPYQVVSLAGEIVESVMTVWITDTPIAEDDASSGPLNTPQILSPLKNDAAEAAPWDASTLRLCAEGQSPPQCDATRVETSDGVYEITAQGKVTFTPVEGFTGAATPVRYQVADAAGQIVDALLRPTVFPEAEVALVRVSKSIVGNEHRGGVVRIVTICTDGEQSLRRVHRLPAGTSRGSWEIPVPAGMRCRVEEKSRGAAKTPRVSPTWQERRWLANQAQSLLVGESAAVGTVRPVKGLLVSTTPACRIQSGRLQAVTAGSCTVTWRARGGGVKTQAQWSVTTPRGQRSDAGTVTQGFLVRAGEVAQVRFRSVYRVSKTITTRTVHTIPSCTPIGSKSTLMFVRGITSCPPLK